MSAQIPRERIDPSPNENLCHNNSPYLSSISDAAYRIVASVWLMLCCSLITSQIKVHTSNCPSSVNL